MIVYKATNITNGKIYVGKTLYTLNYRRSQHESEAKRKAKTYFHKALIKHGFDNFEWEILIVCDKKERLNILEKFYVATYKTFAELYNLTA